MKIVINSCYGGFSLSDKAILRYAEIKNIILYANKEKYTTHYYLVPVEEYERLYAEDKITGTIKRSNALYFSDRDIDRTDFALIQVVEELGEEADGDCANLEVIEIPDGIKFEIQNYDGAESIHEEHRSWR